MRYHKEIYFPLENERIALNSKLNNSDWGYSEHCLDNIKYRISNLEDLLNFVNELELLEEEIFEFYTDISNGITKLCYRVNWNMQYDIILVIDKYKNIITIYLNAVGDRHETLREELYNKGG